MTKPMDKRQILSMAFDEIQAEILTRYNLTPEQRQKIADAEIEFNDWENMTPALPVVTMVVAGHREGIIAPELMGRNKAPIETLGRKVALRCYEWVAALDLEE